MVALVKSYLNCIERLSCPCIGPTSPWGSCAIVGRASGSLGRGAATLSGAGQSIVDSEFIIFKKKCFENVSESCQATRIQFDSWWLYIQVFTLQYTHPYIDRYMWENMLYSCFTLYYSRSAICSFFSSWGGLRLRTISSSRMPAWWFCLTSSLLTCFNICWSLTHGHCWEVVSLVNTSSCSQVSGEIIEKNMLPMLFSKWLTTANFDWKTPCH